jgi:thiamine pyrophosphokinase
MKRVLIIAGGEVSPHTDLKSIINDGLFVIAADSGAENAVKLDIMPDLIIGDMDSVKPEILLFFQARGILIKRFPVHKDKSDLELALDEAVSLNPDEVIITGYSGARTDHFMLNLLFPFVYRNLKIRYLNGFEEIMAGKTQMEIDAPKDSTVSIIPMTPILEGITLKGFLYPLDNEDLWMGSTRGLSNILKEPPGKINYKSGEMLLVINKQLS